MTGKFITFEGGEGTGKSTQARLLADYLIQQGHKVVLTREPGGSPGAEIIRDLLVSGAIDRWTPISEVLMMYAARADHWQNLIQPELAKGTWVICDRFADSSMAYQGYGRGVDLKFLQQLYKMVIGDKQPDRTFVLDINPEIGLQRSFERLNASGKNMSEGRFEAMDLEFHRRLRNGFLEIALMNPDRCIVIDATKSLHIIHQEIINSF